MKPVRALIGALLSGRFPSAILRTVAFIIVYPTKAISGWLNTHVIKEVLKTVPTLAHLYPTATVITIAFLAGILAPCDHRTPAIVSRCVTFDGMTMCDIVAPLPDASACSLSRTSVAGNQSAFVNFYSPSAKADAKESPRIEFTDHFELSKSFSDERSLVRHDIGPFNVVLSSGRWLLPSARYDYKKT